MLTLFSIPKPFRGHIGVIQTNAIHSWTRLQPRPEIILLGDEAGTPEIARELGLRHIPTIERNEYGTPLVNSVFYVGQAAASHPLICYINADIILLSSFMRAVQFLSRQMQGTDFLAVGQRWNVELNEVLDFHTPTWESDLMAYVTKYGELHPPSGIDYFLTPKGFWRNIPPFALGRSRWDNWLIYSARARKVPVVDITPVAMVVHQQHDYSHMPDGLMWIKKGPEAKLNWQLRGGVRGLYTTLDATHILTQQGLRSVPITRHLAGSLCRVKAAATYILTHTFYPWSYPLILTVKLIRASMNALDKLVR